MKNKKNQQNGIEAVVLNCFIRTLKNNGTYMYYRRCVNNTGIMKSILKQTQNRRTDNPFSNSSSSDDVVKTLQKITNDMAKSNGKKHGASDLDKYEVVTMAINHLLHFFMESNGVPMQKLCELGEEIYSMSCYKLFGDTMEDLEKQSEDELSSLKNSDEIRAKLFQEFIVDLQRGVVPSSMNFDDYVKTKVSPEMAKNISVAMPRMGDNVGHMLGRGPEDGMGMRMGDRPAWLDDDGYLDDDDHDDWTR